MTKTILFNPYAFIVWPGGLVVKHLLASAGDVGLVSGLGRSPEGNGHPLQHSCLENSMDTGACHESAGSQKSQI